MRVFAAGVLVRERFFLFLGCTLHGCVGSQNNWKPVVAGVKTRGKHAARAHRGTNTARVKPVKTAARVGGDVKAASVESLCPERCRRATRAWKMA